MNKEYLVFVQHELERRAEWIKKNEVKLTSSAAGDCRDLDDFMEEAKKHDVRYN